MTNSAKHFNTSRELADANTMIRRFKYEGATVSVVNGEYVYVVEDRDEFEEFRNNEDMTNCTITVNGIEVTEAEYDNYIHNDAYGETLVKMIADRG
jgi:thioester reductase-like protein